MYLLDFVSIRVGLFCEILKLGMCLYIENNKIVICFFKV